ncbi:helix-turn-helix domain-containing protein [Myroides pelagicus]|uniref:Helix-turn-helix domain-containing protein n=1 Tax=Myroides pelagicus TaxID=270914 RepID=A0A7K1GMY0_9FLAO|nr:helix-turn-helix domain-containing protein [Myroides pelagicus]MEC4114367.1 helix-turn-helix domain-containing protein [Myroides pelagicus]MTH30090.1 helix-turn-helix domain-containing protein [Myroides pelagicus]
MTNTRQQVQIPSNLIESRKLPKEDFKIYTQEEGKKLIIPYNMTSYYKVSYLKSKSKFFSGTRVIELEGPTLFFSNPLSPYTFEPISNTPEGYFCLFSNNFLGFKSNLMRSVLFHLEQNPVFHLTTEQENLISFVFEQMRDEYNESYTQKTELLRNYIEIIIHQSNKLNVAHTVESQKNAPHRLCSQFLELLEKQFPITSVHDVLDLKTANDFASNLHVHTNHLNFTINKVLGKSTTTCIQERILTEAKKLLLTTDWSVSEIAYALGFEYPTYFSCFFKKATKVSPVGYRKA